MAYIIAAPCIGVNDTACVTVRPVERMHPTKDDPDCGAVTMLFNSMNVSIVKHALQSVRSMRFVQKVISQIDGTNVNG